MLLSLNGCGGADLIPLPEGPQILTGTLLPTDLSLLRRGTHLLQIDGVDTYYVESTFENLRKYERKTVVLEGLLSHNVEPTLLPVLDVLRVVDVLGDSQKKWEIRSLNLTLSVPASWSAEVQEGSATFRSLGSTDPLVRITRGTGAIIDVSGGTPIVLGNARAMRIIHEATGAQTVVVERGEETIVFSFTPGERQNALELREDWLMLLATVSFSRENAPSSVAPGTGSGAVVGQPCGGTAGVLCPEGYYCDVVNLQENIGICKAL